MRFRKRHKYRPPVQDSLARQSDVETGGAAQTMGRVQVRSKGSAGHAPADVEPGQDLLGALGDFQQSIALGRSKGVHGTWRDDTMAHLVTGYRVAKQRQWEELAHALADTGRILQTYVNGRAARDSLPLLQSSYQTLCLMVGDRMAGQGGEALREQWQQHYQEALMAIKAAGLSLAQDRENTSKVTTRVKPAIAAHQRDEERSYSSDDDWGGDLPVLEELPPLESLLDGDAEADASGNLDLAYDDSDETGDDADSRGKNGDALADWVEKESTVAEEPETAEAEVEDGPALEHVSIMEEDDEVEIVETPAPVAETPASSGPPKIVVDILDRLADQLRSIERTTGDERALHLERFSGAIGVLKREADKHGYDAGGKVCAAMEDTCVLALATEGALSEKFMDMAYAFGGTFMEAHEDGETKAVTNWIIESNLLVENWEAAPEAESVETPEVAVEEETQLSIEPVVESAAAPVEKAEPIAEAPKPVERPVAAAPAFTMPVTDDAPTSHELLAYAQKAATQGDGTGAKFLALRAAAQFAKEETYRAEQSLRATEEKLTRSMEATGAAREQVKSAEEGVMKSAKEVADGENKLGAIQERCARIAQHLEEVQANATRIEEEIRALQEKLAQEQQKAEQTQEQLGQSKEVQGNTESELEQLRRDEEAARLNLEKRRQEVKDHQQSTLEIEAEMHMARDQVTQQRTSLADIEQTIEQIAGNERGFAEKADALLF